MEVMDLSMPKPPQIQSYSPPPYTVLQQPHQQHLLLQQQQQQFLLQQQQHLLQFQQQHQYANSAQPSVNHLGLFQQLQFNSLPPLSPVLLPSPVERTSPPVRHDAAPSYPENEALQKEPGKNKESTCKPNGSVKRPFKLIVSAKNPSTLSFPALIDPNSDEAYEEYRNKVLSQIVKGETEPNRNMRRTIPSNPEKCNDPEYLERRKKNNEAAKKSREARKAKEDEIAIRVSFLEQENLKLKFQLAAIERQKKIYLMRLEQQQKRHNTTMCF